MTEARQQFRRVNGHNHLPGLPAALAKHLDLDPDHTTCDTDQSVA